MEKIVITAITATILAGCITGDRSAGRGTIVDNELRTGFIYLSDGSPAVNARIRVYPVDYAPDSSAIPKTAAGSYFATRTDERGGYHLDSLSSGEYNILAESEGRYSMQDSVYLSVRTDSVPSDTLDEPGSVSGVVVLQPQDDPQSVLVQALGTNSYTNVDGDGRFTLHNLGAGRYTLRVSTTYADYNSLIVPARVRTGKADTLPDSLFLPFTGIPVVQGLRASYDTLTGVVTLSWNRVKYRSFSEYQIFRDRSPALSLSDRAIASTQDTVFRDAWDIRTEFADMSYAKWEYRVRVMSLTDHIGPAYGKMVVDVVDPARITTQINPFVAKVHWDSSSQKDVYRVVARLTNAGRGIESLSWAMGAPDDSGAFRSLDGGHAYTDTFDFAWDRQGPFSVYMKAVDDGKGKAIAELKIAGNSAPTLSGDPAKSVYALAQYLFAPDAKDPDGDVLRFSIAGKPSWAIFDTATGILSGSPSNEQAGIYRGISISVTDGRRSASLPAFDILAKENPHGFMKTFPGQLGTSNPQIVELKGKIYAIANWPELNENLGIRIYDPTADAWTDVLPLRDSPLNFQYTRIFIRNGLIYFAEPDMLRYYDPVAGEFGILDRGINGYKFMATASGKAYFSHKSETYPFKTRLYEYDFDSRTFSARAILPDYLADRSNAWDYEGIEVNGKIFAICGFQNPSYTPDTTFFMYDPATDSWSIPAANPNFRANTTQCTVGGKVYQIGGEGYQRGLLTFSDAVDEYDPVADLWRSVSGLLSYQKHAIRCAEVDGKVYFMFGDEPPFISGKQDTPENLKRYEIEVYDPALEK